MTPVNPLVQKQYTEWPVPKPLDDLEAWKARGGYKKCDPTLDHDLYWPERVYNPEMSILVAGCGTMQAALEAYDNPRASVVGIDVSPASLEHAARLKQKHNLVNLELRRIDLHNVTSLGRKFDLIISYGVLHHLPNPASGLAALSEVVEDDGLISLALYSKYLRAGVYMFQDAMRCMGVEHTTDDIAFARSVFELLPPRHPLHLYFQHADNIVPDDVDMVDTLLHRQDCAFTVPDILALAEMCNLNFQGWFDNLDYYPEGILPVNPALYQRLTKLPEREQWKAVELLSPAFGCHRFFLRKKTSDVSKYKIDFEDPSFTKMVPSCRRQMHLFKEKKGSVRLEREWHTFLMRGMELELFLSINGKTIIGEIIANIAKGNSEKEKDARRFFQRMWKLGHITLSKVQA